MNRKAAPMVEHEGRPFQVIGEEFLQDSVDVLTQLGKSLGTVGDSILISMSVGSKQDVVIWAPEVPTGSTSVPEGLCFEEFLKAGQVVLARVLSSTVYRPRSPDYGFVHG